MSLTLDSPKRVRPKGRILKGLPYKPNYINLMPPGELLVEKMAEMGIDTLEMANRMQVPAETIEKLLKYEIPLTQPLADKIEEATRMSAAFMMRVEQSYRTKLVFAAEHPEIPAYLGEEIVNQPKKRQRQRRSGVVLLVVLALMALFAALATTFMVITTNARRSAEQTAEMLISGGESQNFLTYQTRNSDTDTAMNKLLTGGLDSVIGPYSILENLYGQPADNSGIKGNFENTELGKAPFTLSLTDNDTDTLMMLGNVVTVIVEKPESAYNGNHDLAARESKGNKKEYHSTFIIGIEDKKLTLAPIPALGDTPMSGKYIINTPAFSGTGAGYQTAAANQPLLAKDDETSGKPKPFALRPNILAPNSDGVQKYKKHLEDDKPLMNPDYTAADYMTMFLAWNHVNENNKLEKVIPSFHRPQLVEYWGETDKTELRKYVLRPLWTDHPNFTGSNPAAKFDKNLPETEMEQLKKFLTEGPWDVDGDGDGHPDGIWIDAGLPARYDEKTQSWVKPLVSYYVVDLDGRGSVNTFGSLPPDKDEKFKDKNGSIDAAGSGTGSAELELKKEVIEERYGTDGKPDVSADTKPEWLEWLTASYKKGGINPDWFGNSPIQFDPLGNRYIPPQQITANPNPYLFNPYTSAGDDKPFTSDDIEFLLRSVGDADYNNLALSQLRKLLDDNFTAANPKFAKPENRFFVTNRSSSIPAAVRMIADGTDYRFLYEYIKEKIYSGDDDKAGKLWNLLPEEIRRGEKADLNRLTHHPDWITADQAKLDGLLEAKAKFAQEMYYLLAVLCHQKIETGTGYKSGLITKEKIYTRLAQWSVNLVDFIDPDQIMTPFVFSTAPWTSTPYDNEDDIAKVIASNPNSLSADIKLIWGFEKPEMALTETLAVHNRGVADSDKETPGGKRTGGDSGEKDFDQVIRPQGSLFVELYRQGNLERKDGGGYPDNDLVETDGTLNLAKKTTAGDYVWRLAISKKTMMEDGDTTLYWEWRTAGETKNDLLDITRVHPNEVPQMLQWTTDTDANAKLKPDRFIWFGTDIPRVINGKTDDETALKRHSFVNKGAVPVKLEPNQYLVIAPRKLTSFKSEEVGGTHTQFGEPAIVDGKLVKGIDTEYLDIPNDADQVPVTMIAGAAAGITVPTGLPDNYYGVNVSEPLPDLPTLTAPYNNFTAVGPTPLDTGELFADGTIPCYRTICLQRLADPNREYHPTANPYIMVDWNMIDLRVTNSEKDSQGAPPANEDDANNHRIQTNIGNDYFVSRQWGNDRKNFVNIWQRTFFKYDTHSPGLDTTANPWHTFGYLNNSFKAEPANDGDYKGVPPDGKTFLHFPWNNAPLTNTLELMLVPATAAESFGLEFIDANEDSSTAVSFFGSESLGLEQTSAKDRFAFRAGTAAGLGYGLYLNFFHQGDDSLNLAALFDYVRVPSPFAGTVNGWTDDVNVPKKPHYQMREPGKVNINTLNEETWKKLQGGRTYTDSQNRLPFNAVKSLSDTPPSEFKPFRSPGAANLVPPLQSGNVKQSSLFQLVEPDDAVGTVSTNPYTALEKTMRLSALTTNRSNVFAVWVTVGYFNAEKFATAAELHAKYPALTDNENVFKVVYPDGCVLGSEKGLDNGSVQRHRSFYLIDRSIPASFRRGETLNSRNVIIKESELD
ncbi:MAG: hypothetical protein LBT46_12645 [Planctomycetaceae bacterium]|nr:hypothetical protein [Planctomycetaceae bacterium]